MSFNGSGTFLINSTGQPVVANTVISATVFNALTADLASGLTNCITKDGQSTPTANIPMGSNKITGLANGTLINDAATLGQVQTTAAKLITSVSGVDTVTGIMSPTLTAYAAGQLFYFVAVGANTGAVTLNIDGLGAKAVTRDGSTALAAGDINSGEMVVVIYDGTRFQMINAANSFGNTTINGTLTVTGKSNLAEVSTPSINASVAAVTALTATGASVASANVGTAVITSLQATGASAASINAGVALLTTATVTNLQATGASIASANIGNLQFTAASIASINAGVAVVTNLTATSASIASANVGTAVVTTGTVTNLSSTSASIASANAAVALVTTGTVTNLTSTAASIASANLGTAAITTLTATQASVGSINAAVALVTDGTVTTLSGTQASITSANHAVVRLLGSVSGYVGLQGAAAAGSTTYTLPSADGSNGQILTTNGSAVLSWISPAGGGDVVGPASATDNAITRFDLTTGKLIQNSTVILDDAGTITGVASLAAVTASITSANAGTAVITTLTATGASVASINAAVALVTTGTVTNLTSTSASIASANIGTAVITALTVTGASIASANMALGVFNDGTSTAPSITNNGDTNTGAYFPAADEMAVTTGGTVAAAFNSNGLFFRNRVINGDMRIDQRNAGANVTLSGSANYPVDRFVVYTSSGSSNTGARSTTVPTGFKNSLLVTVGTGAAPVAASYNQIGQIIEGFNVADLGYGAAGALTTTLSFWVRASITGTYCVALANASTAGTRRSYIAEYSISSADTWEYKTVTIAGDTSGTWTTDNGQGLQVWFDIGSGSNYQSTANAWGNGAYFRTSSQTNLIATNGATFYLTGVQLETGSVATPFERRPYGTELMLCQRYFEKSYPIATAIGTGTGPGVISSSTNTTATVGYLSLSHPYKVTKRASPTVVIYDTAGTSGVSQRATPGVGSTNGENATIGANSNDSNLLLFSASGNSHTQLICHYTASAEL